MNKPLITIGITCFNAEKTIERALLSAINQDWPNFEIIVVDDASTDSSKIIDLCNRYNINTGMECHTTSIT